ncbi:hypothetical protein Tco_0983214, partial [Tanacetum coccineum]
MGSGERKHIYTKIECEKPIFFNGTEYAVLIFLNEYAVLDRKLDMPYPMEVDTPYRFIDQNSGLEYGRYGVSKVLDMAYRGFLGIGTTFDIFQNIVQIRHIFLDGYGVLVFRTINFKISLFKLQNACLLVYLYQEIGKSSRIDDEVVQDQRQRDDNDLQDKRQDQPKEEEVEPRRSKRARTEKSFGPDFVSFMVENEPTSYQEA